MIIGLSGKKQSGKSTVTNFLTRRGFMEVSWAAPLKKKIGMELLGLTHEQVYGTEEDKEAVDDFWGRSPRELLQIIGTECFRNLVHPDFWVKLGVKEIRAQTFLKRNVVVSDCRFPNEIEAVKKLGGSSVRIIREGQSSTDRHPSETALDRYDFDYIITAKSGDLDGLKMRMDQILQINAI